MNVLGVSILSALVVLVLLGPRRWALLGMVAGILYLTQGQFVAVGGFTLYPVRVLEVVALVRVIARREFPTDGLGRLGRALILLYVFSVGVFVLRSTEDVVYQIGAGVDAICLYAVFRSLVRNIEEFRWLLRVVALMLVPYACLVWMESLTFQNSFASVGGVELIRAGNLWIREGRLRAVGSFGHPSLLGTVGGAFLSLYIGLWFARPAERMYAFLGATACLGIVGASNSGGPMICVVAAVVGWLLWPLRGAMHLVRRGLVAMLIVLPLVMNAPIWYVLARISDITGGDGHHRAVLLDVGFQHLDRWWFAGMPARETGRWLPYANTNTGAVDMTNNFLSFGVNAGLGALFLLVALLTVAYSQLGRAMSTLRARAPPNVERSAEPLYWGLGVMLSVHAFNWFGITYWDQTSAIWFLHLAAIGSLTEAVLRKTPQAGTTSVEPVVSNGSKVQRTSNFASPGS
jgi:hypothetical protein